MTQNETKLTKMAKNDPKWPKNDPKWNDFFLLNPEQNFIIRMSFHHSDVILTNFIILMSFHHSDVIPSFRPHSKRISSFWCHSIILYSFQQNFIIWMSFHYSDVILTNFIILMSFHHSDVIPSFRFHSGVTPSFGCHHSNIIL